MRPAMAAGRADCLSFADELVAIAEPVGHADRAQVHVELVARERGAGAIEGLDACRGRERASAGVGAVPIEFEVHIPVFGAQ